MRFSTVAAALLAAVPAFVSAQTGTTTAPGATTTVMVGMNGTLTFTPSSVNVAQGGTIEFVFLSKNHSVVQSSFTDPCNPLPNGFQAAFFPIAADVTSFPTVTIQVNQTTPIWFYCPQTNPAAHCKLGMVGAVNPTADKTFQAFQATAMGAAPPATSNTTGTTGTTGGTTGTPSVPGGTAPGSAPAPGTSSTGGSPPVVVAPPVTPGSTNSSDPATAGGATGNGTTPSAAFKNGASGFVVALGVVAGSLLAL